MDNNRVVDVHVSFTTWRKRRRICFIVRPLDEMRRGKGRGWRGYRQDGEGVAGETKRRKKRGQGRQRERKHYVKTDMVNNNYNERRLF
jgi:hypothetical protein